MRFIATYTFRNNDGSSTQSGEFDANDAPHAEGAVLHASLLVLGADDVSLTRETDGNRVTFTGHSRFGQITAIVAPV